MSPSCRRSSRRGVAASASGPDSHLLTSKDPTATAVSNCPRGGPPPREVARREPALGTGMPRRGGVAPGADTCRHRVVWH
jgi:hypothetical protein